MMLLLHGLPISTKYQDVKLLLKRETSLNNFTLDNLTTEGDGTKQVSIGVTDEREASHLMKCISGYRMPPGNILRISLSSVGKSMSVPQSMNTPSQNSYDQRGFPSRNNYEPTPEFPYNRSMPNEPGNRLDPWGSSGGQRNHWEPNQSGSSQGMQQSYGYQGAGNAMSSGQLVHGGPLQRPEMRPYQQTQPQDQRYGYQPKSNMPDTSKVQAHKHTRSTFLRSVEIVDEPLARSVGHPADSYSDRRAQQKPMTIMKDNFQGPQFDRPTQGSQFPTQNQPWGQQNPTPYDRKYPEPEKRSLMSEHGNGYKGSSGPRFSPHRDIKNQPRFSPRKDIPKDMGGPRFSPRRDIKGGPGPRFSPRRDMKDLSGPRFSPRRDIKDISGPRFSPRRDLKDVSGPSGPRFSPRRDMKPATGPRFSPRRDVPRFSPRRDKDGPRFSPRRDLGKDGPMSRYSPTREIHMSHHGRRHSPGPTDSRRRDIPPGHRRASPGGNERYSPTRHLDKGEKYPDRGFKEVRPAYEPSAQASNQAMYSGGYRPNIHENVQYPVPGHRAPEQRPLTWQENKPAFVSGMKKGDERDVGRMPKFEPRIEPRDVMDKRSPGRKSRSPLRRERSPTRDRFKKHSPSPRSPRRSWALEKRRSPEAREPPPPPMWPGQNPNRPDEYRGRNFEPREEEKPRAPVWERPAFDDKLDRPRRPDDRAFVEDARIKVRTDLGRPAVEFDRAAAGHDFRRAEDVRKPFDDHHARREDRRAESPRRDGRMSNVQDKLQKEIDDVYKRAVEFHKRVEERRGGERRRDEFDDRSREAERHAPKEFDYREEDRRHVDARHDVIRYDEPRVREEPRNFREEPRHIREGPRNIREEPRNIREEPRNIREEPRSSRGEPSKPSGWRPDHDKQDELNAETKAKREKAVEEISQRILAKYGTNFNRDLKRRVQEELKITLGKLIREMFGADDVSFIEMVIKFNAKYDVNDEKKIFDQIMSGFPSNIRNLKRSVEETVQLDEVPPKTAKISSEPHLNRDVTESVVDDPVNISDWNIQPASMLPLVPTTPYDLMPQIHNMPMPQLVIPSPIMVPAPTYSLHEESRFQERSPPSRHQERHSPIQSFNSVSDPRDGTEGYNMYLCKDDSEPFSECQAEYLKKFLVQQLFKVSASGQGWTPDFMIKGLQTRLRFEVVTNDEATRDWINNLDYSQFDLFNVLVYTKEELWYERAAVWLPGHSRCRNIEPLSKLKLQNKKLTGINIGKWKCVKKVVNVKGTRLYVDMPPSSARALEKHKMMLSYELHKVSVLLRAAAVDKESFDIGMKDVSMVDPAEIVNATQNSPMPTLGDDPNLIKIALKGNKSVSLTQARKIKEMIIYHIYKYQQQSGTLRTDFVKFGLCNPGYFGLLPENSDSRRWLMNLQIGKINKHPIVVLGSDSDTKYIQVEVAIEDDEHVNMAVLAERLRQSNKGVKGLYLSKWKPIRVKQNRRGAVLHIDMDLESLETLSKMDFKLDYVNDRNKQWTVDVMYGGSRSRLEEKIKRLKTEEKDSYVVDDMEIDSDFEMEDDDDIIYVGKVSA